MVETSFQIRDAERTERAIVAQPELWGLRLDVSRGSIAGTEPLGVSEDVVDARLPGYPITSVVAMQGEDMSTRTML